MTDKEKSRGRALTPRRVRKRMNRIGEMADEKAQKRALRRLRIKVLKRIAEGTASKPQVCARMAFEPFKDPSKGT